MPLQTIWYSYTYNVANAHAHCYKMCSFFCFVLHSLCSTYFNFDSLWHSFVQWRKTKLNSNRETVRLFGIIMLEIGKIENWLIDLYLGLFSWIFASQNELYPKCMLFHCKPFKWNSFLKLNLETNNKITEFLSHTLYAIYLQVLCLFQSAHFPYNFVLLFFTSICNWITYIHNDNKVFSTNETKIIKK